MVGEIGLPTGLPPAVVNKITWHPAADNAGKCSTAAAGASNKFKPLFFIWFPKWIISTIASETDIEIAPSDFSSIVLSPPLILSGVGLTPVKLILLSLAIFWYL